jgi:hypothetical protein
MDEHVYEHRIYMLHMYCRMQLNVMCNLSYATTQICSRMSRMQLNVMCNLSYATTQICSRMSHMQLNFSCKRQLQNPKFLVVLIWRSLLNFFINPRIQDLLFKFCPK